MNWKYLDVAAVEALHYKQIEMFGGSHGLRDAGLLESAVFRAEHRAYFDPEASLAALAASLGYGLIKNHAFIDGNKRRGVLPEGGRLSPRRCYRRADQRRAAGRCQRDD